MKRANDTRRRNRLPWQHLLQAAGLALLMLAIAPGTVKAQAEVSQEEAVVSYEVNGNVRYFENLKVAVDAANKDAENGISGGTIKLLKDAYYDDQDYTNGSYEQKGAKKILTMGTYTIDLNGKKCSGKIGDEFGVITVCSETLTLINSDPDHVAKLNTYPDFLPEYDANHPDKYPRKNMAVMVMGSGKLEIGGSKNDPTLKSYGIDFWGASYAVVLRRDTSGNDNYANAGVTFDANEDALISILGGTNYFEAIHIAGIRASTGTVEILGGVNTIEGHISGSSYDKITSGFYINNNGTVRISGGQNIIKGLVYAVYTGRYSTQCQGSNEANLSITGGNNVLEGGNGVIGIKENAVDYTGPEADSPLNLTLDSGLFWNASGSDPAQGVTYDDIKNLTKVGLVEQGTVTFDGNGGKTASDEGSYDQKMMLYQETALDKNQFVKEHYSFTGWKDGDQEYQDGVLFNLKEKTATLKAQWEAESWKVTLNTDGGSIQSGKGIDKYSYDVEASLPAAATITKQGYTFRGWFDNAAFKGNAVTMIPAGATGDQTFYAKWEKNPDPKPSDQQKDGGQKLEDQQDGDQQQDDQEQNGGQQQDGQQQDGQQQDGQEQDGQQKDGQEQDGQQKDGQQQDGQQKEGEQPGGETAFSDVSNPDKWYYVPVKWAVENQITTGVDRTHFAPNQQCTRAQALTFLYRAKGRPAVEVTSRFIDVPAGTWYSSPVAWAVEKGITSGTSITTFGSKTPCSRAQLVTFLWREAGTPDQGTASGFTDVAEDSWYAKAVTWAAKKGITTGIGDGKFGSDITCTRAQSVTMIYKALH